MEKMFKGDAVCPYTGNPIDSPACRQCQWFFRSGTYTFIWCSHPVQEKAKETTKSKLPASKKTATRKPVRPKQKAKGNSKQIKTDTTPKKRGCPKKAK